MRRVMRAGLSWALFVSLAGGARAQGAEGSELEALARRFETDAGDLRRFHHLDDRPMAEARLEAFEETWRARLGALDYEALGVAGRVDWHLLQRQLERSAESRRVARQRRADIAELIPFAEPLLALEEARWTLQPVDEAAVAAQLDALAEGVDALRERVRAAVPDADADADADSGEAEAPSAFLSADPVRALRAARAVEEVRAALGTWYEHFAPYRPGFAWWLERPRGRLDEALTAYAEHLRKKIAAQAGEDDDPLLGEPLGPQALARAIALERLAYDAGELEALGERELAWCEARLAEAAAELGLADARAAIGHVKGLGAPPGGQDQLVAEFARAAIRFLEERRLVTLDPLCIETWRVTMLDAAGQRDLPFAAYGGQEIQVAYPSSEMGDADKRMSLRGNNAAFTRIVTPHELIPGHHLQRWAGARFATWRRPASTPFFTEGWPVHWELRLWDLGWARGPEDRVGMLFWRMHRAARIVLSLRYHGGATTPTEMIEFLVQRLGHERANATAEVRRWVGDGYGPLYQCGYLVGALQLRALHRELVGSTFADEGAFHDAALRQGPIPIELLRAALSGTRLPRDWRPAWRFAD